jgi:hypothetical protein
MKLQSVLVLLLSTTVFGFPRVNKDDNTGLGVLDNVVKGLTDGSDIQSVVIDKVKEGVAKIDKLMKDVEVKITEITKDIGVINTERSESLREAYTTYRRIKVTLKDTRVELRRLAVQTELKTSDLILYMKSWDHEKYSSQEQKEYLKEQVEILKQLLEESNVILTDAKGKYDQAYLDFNTINARLEDFKLKVDLMLDEKTAEHQSWVVSVRAGIYGTAGGLTVLFGILDAVGCLGFCSGIGTSITWAASTAAAEAEIARVSAKIDEFGSTVLSSIESVDDITETTKGLQKFIEHETNIIVKWHESVKHMQKYVDDATQDNFYRLTLKRERYEANLVKLRAAAQEFIDQPENIFGEDILDKVLNDPKRREQEHNERTALRARALCAKSSESKEDYEKCVKKF